MPCSNLCWCPCSSRPSLAFSNLHPKLNKILLWMNRKIRGIENSAWESSRPGGGREILHLAHTIAATTCTDSSLFLWRGLGDRMTTRGKKRWERSADNSWFTGGWWQQHTSGRRRARRWRHGRTHARPAGGGAPAPSLLDLRSTPSLSPWAFG